MKLDSKILRAAEDLRLRARRPVTSTTGGNYRTRYRGTGMQFKEFRQYEIGDDIRHMAWTVTARTGRPTIKLYEEERNLEVCIAVDVSKSSILAAGGPPKLQIYTELAAMFALAALRSGDSFSLALFSDGVQHFFPASRSRTRLSLLLAEIEKAAERGERTDLNSTMAYLQRTLRSHSLVVLLSDFNAPSFAGSLAPLAKRHEVIAVHTTDAIERGIGKGIYETADPETGELACLDLGSGFARSLAESRFNHTQKALAQSFTAHRAEYLHLKTEDDYLGTIVRYFHGRGALVR